MQLHVVPSRAVDEVLGLLPSGLTSFDRNRVEIREFKDGLAVGFLPPERAERVSPAFNTFLVLVNLGLFAALVAILLVEQHNALEDLSFNMRSARSAAAQANSVQARIDELHVGVERLMEAKSKRPASVQILDEIARRPPTRHGFIGWSSKEIRCRFLVVRMRQVRSSKCLKTPKCSLVHGSFRQSPRSPGRAANGFTSRLA